MIISSEDLKICRELENWPQKMSHMVKTAWMGEDGICYFPYPPFTTPEFWETAVLKQWRTGEMMSLTSVEGQRVLAHVALINKGHYHEIGRCVAYPDSPKGAVTELSKMIMEIVREKGICVQLEATQAHTASQFICESIGLRFAGFGFLSKINGVSWDILYYDNAKMNDFSPQPGILGDPVAGKVLTKISHRERLEEIKSIITIERGGVLPPKKFHVLPHRLKTARKIIEVNLAFLS